MFLVPLILSGPTLLQPLAADPPAAAETWSTSFYGFWTEPPHGDSYLSAIVGADRGSMHLEARWQYEDRDTASFFFGRTTTWEGDVHGSVTPMLGFAVGQTDGIVPAVSLDLGWQSLVFTSDAEFLIGISDGSEDFLYSWNELAWVFAEKFSLGIVGQRTNLFDQELTVDRGLLVGAMLGKVWLTAYWFNPDLDDPYFTLAVGGGF